jgi:16S rRNA (adenine1518-N6/adenine1519-N6)-dimethyltransferase
LIVASLPFAKKSLGQHWLTDVPALTAMCEAADIKSGDTVLEIGPGIGTLTKLLVTRAKHVVAVEFDESLAHSLPKKLPAANLEIIHHDILTFDFTKLPPDYKIAANIPYYLTSHLLRILSETSNPPSLATLLVQKEVAERVSASAGEMSLLSVTAQFYWEVERGTVVPGRLFTPPPKVDSQILILKRRTNLLFPDIDEKKFFRLVKAGFSARRKTLLNSLSGGLRVGKEDLQKALSTAAINPGLRAQALSLQEWYALYRSLAGLQLI